MSINTIAVIYVALFVLLSLGLAVLAFLLIMAGHPYWALAFGCGGFIAMLCGASVKVGRS